MQNVVKLDWLRYQRLSEFCVFVSMQANISDSSESVVQNKVLPVHATTFQTGDSTGVNKVLLSRDLVLKPISRLAPSDLQRPTAGSR